MGCSRRNRRRWVCSSTKYSRILADWNSRISRIAIRCCYKFRKPSPDAYVLWVHGGNRARFESGNEDIARALDIPDFDNPKINTLQLISNWLSDGDNVFWLLVLDKRG